MTRVHGRTGRRSLEAVITFLEMSARPARLRHPTPMRKLALLRAEKPPLSFYFWLYRTVGAGWHWTDRLSWTRDEVIATVHDPRVEIHVLYVGGVPAGFAEVDFRAAGTADLGQFGLLPEFIGQRLGGYYLDWVLDTMWRPGIEKVTVDTNTLDHPRALAMYQKAGFQVVGREVSWIVPEKRFAGATVHSVWPDISGGPPDPAPEGSER